jgi:hypothetical protein
MIVFDLECRSGGHRFEGWFGSSEDFARQHERGLVACPDCGEVDIIKAPMAPRLARKGNQVTVAGPRRDVAPAPVSTPSPQAAAPGPVTNQPPPLPPELRAALQMVAKAQAEAIKTSQWVGDKFADDARAMHYGDKAHAAIHGQATPEQARDLVEEGIEIAPLLIPIVPPESLN